MKDLFYLSKRLGTSWSNGSLPIRCLHLRHSRQFYLWKPDVEVQRRWLHWWSWSKSKGKWGKKLKQKIEAAEQIEEDAVDFGLGEGKQNNMLGKWMIVMSAINEKAKIQCENGWKENKYSKEVICSYEN